MMDRLECNSQSVIESIWVLPPPVIAFQFWIQVFNVVMIQSDNIYFVVERFIMNKTRLGIWRGRLELVRVILDFFYCRIRTGADARQYKKQ